MSKTVTKADIAKSICAQSEMKQQHAKKVLDAMLGIMKKKASRKRRKCC
ncbi:HU family DNA-binding protein [Bilophila wadsworthia]|nr:HU family DNA-binding protein [Bilophila wadsworthia]